MKKLPAWAILGIIALVAGTLLGITNMATEAQIMEQTKAASELARVSVMPDATGFEAMELQEGASVDSCYRALGVDGYAVAVTVQGYGGPIEVVTGILADGTVTGISVGGEGFSETSGLGSKVRDAAFTDQFQGKTATFALKNKSPDGNVDSVSAASISSGAVCGAVNIASDFVKGLG